MFENFFFSLKFSERSYDHTTLRVFRHLFIRILSVCKSLVFKQCPFNRVLSLTSIQIFGCQGCLCLYEFRFKLCLGQPLPLHQASLKPFFGHQFERVLMPNYLCRLIGSTEVNLSVHGLDGFRTNQ